MPYNRAELIAPPPEQIKPEVKPKPGAPQVFLPPSAKALAVSPDGEAAPSAERLLYWQGFQRGWTEAASVRLLQEEAEEQGMTQDDPEWRSLAAEVKDEDVPIPSFLEEDKARLCYREGYQRGWVESNQFKTVDKRP